MSAVEDFSDIAAKLKQIEQAKEDARRRDNNPPAVVDCSNWPAFGCEFDSEDDYGHPVL